MSWPPFHIDAEGERPNPDVKATALLERWLSDDQLKTYREKDYIDVVGGDTGFIYRIFGRKESWTRPINVYQLTGYSGQYPIRWCFSPNASVPWADKMLAQMIALRTREHQVRSNIAISHPFDENPAARLDY